jgi:O-acetyl-ADP-ribose deacetylase
MDAQRKISVVMGDITAVPVDVIVNAANSSLLGGGGVDGAIHRRGGPAILAECRALRAGRLGGGLPTGQAVATTAGDLPARWVVHTVGPVWSDSEDRSGLLHSAYAESMRVAGELGAASVAFPAISCGVYRWPLDSAARIAVAAVRGSPAPVAEVRFVLFTPDAYEAFAAALDTAPA